MGVYLKLTVLNDIIFAKDSEKTKKKLKIFFSFRFFEVLIIVNDSMLYTKKRRNQTLSNKKNGIEISIIVLKLGAKMCNMRKK